MNALLFLAQSVLLLVQIVLVMMAWRAQRSWRRSAKRVGERYKALSATTASVRDYYWHLATCSQCRFSLERCMVGTILFGDVDQHLSYMEHAQP